MNKVLVGSLKLTLSVCVLNSFDVCSVYLCCCPLGVVSLLKEILVGLTWLYKISFALDFLYIYYKL